MGEFDLVDLVRGKVSMDDYCGPDYWRWEERVTAYLKSEGHVVGHFWTIDACGPLVRGVKVGGQVYSYA